MAQTKPGTQISLLENTYLDEWFEGCSGMFRDADLKKKATNHSLRATGTTELYRCGVPENVIKERTRHKSIDRLKAYERTSVEQHLVVSKILSDVNRPVSGSFKTMMEKEEIVEKRKTTNWKSGDDAKKSLHLQ